MYKFRAKQPKHESVPEPSDRNTYERDGTETALGWKEKRRYDQGRRMRKTGGTHKFTTRVYEIDRSWCMSYLIIRGGA